MDPNLIVIRIGAFWKKPRLPRRHNEIESKDLKAYCCTCNLLITGLIVLLRSSDENKAPKKKFNRNLSLVHAGIGITTNNECHPALGSLFSFIPFSRKSRNLSWRRIQANTFFAGI
jgi:hypothetical protein